MVIFTLNKPKKEYSMLQNSQVWLFVTWSADFESRLVPRTGLTSNNTVLVQHNMFWVYCCTTISTDPDVTTIFHEAKFPLSSLQKKNSSCMQKFIFPSLRGKFPRHNVCPTGTNIGCTFGAEFLVLLHSVIQGRFFSRESTIFR